MPSATLTLILACDIPTRDRVAKEIARVLLFHEHCKTGISRAELKNAAMADMTDSRGEIFEYALEHAKFMMKHTFGLDVTQLKGDEEADLKTTGTSVKFTLVNKLARTAVPLEEERYSSLVLVVLGLIRYSSGKLNEKTLWKCLASMGLSKEARSFKTVTPPPIKKSRRVLNGLDLLDGGAQY
jgi:hypothetical protein